MIYSNPTAMGKHIAKLIKKFNSIYYNPFYYLPTTMTNIQLREIKPGDLINIPNTARRGTVVDVLPNSFFYRIDSDLLGNNLLIQDFDSAEKEDWSVIKYVHTVEQKPDVRYNSNGSLFNLPINASSLFWFTKYYSVTYINNKYQVTGTSYAYPSLIPQAIFMESRLFDNKEKAEWWADMLTTNMQFAKRLEQINFNNTDSPKCYAASYNLGSGYTLAYKIGDGLIYQGAFILCSEAWHWFSTTHDYTETQKIDFIKWHR